MNIPRNNTPVEDVLELHKKRAKYRALAHKFMVSARLTQLESDLTEFLLFNFGENEDE